MRKEIILTADGSHSIRLPEHDMGYHSKYGAITESRHIFIEDGFRFFENERYPLSIFEMGFGSGLNALLTLIEAEKSNRTIYYETIEKFPLEKQMVSSINFCKQLQRPDLHSAFKRLHQCNWDQEIDINPVFLFKKIKTGIESYFTQRIFHIIYYDAFDASFQPELWTVEIFEKLFHLLFPGGILVTYSSKGEVRRALTAAGFIVNKLPGPKGKREITRAVRPL
jgi:tRNA U34 5-methylaminomethyl-2-thiouridine-forming methyltransferase MnmC